MTILQAYFDDSGIGQPHAYCLAGFIAKETVWQQFSRDWAAMLKTDPPVPYWKTTSLMAFRRQFTYWSQTERDSRLKSACLIIQSYQLFCFSISMSHQDYIDVFSDVIGVKAWHPYKLLFTQLLLNIDSYAREKLVPHPIEVIFDTQTEQKDALLSAWQSAYGDKSPASGAFVKPPTWMDEKEALPLQAADLVAWDIRQNMNKSFLEMKPRVLPWSPTGTVDGVMVHLTRLSLINLRLNALYELLIGNKLWPDIFSKSKVEYVFNEIYNDNIRGRSGGFDG